MKPQEIKNLLNKFYEGETNLAEENKLRAVFNDPDLQEDLKTEAAFFQTMHLLKADYQAKGTNLKLHNPAIPKRRFSRSFQSLAATITIFVLLAGAIALWFNPASDKEPLAVKDEQPISHTEAKNEVARALDMISIAMQSSTQELETIYNLNTIEDEKIK